MKRITPLVVAAVTLAGCENRAPTAPAVSQAPTVLAAVTSMGAIQTAQATVINCQGTGLIASLNVQYGTCTTDENGGQESVAFSNGGLTVALSAKTHQGAAAAAAFWESNGPVNATSQICVSVSVTQSSTRGLGEVQEQLRLSYNGAAQAPLITAVTATGEQSYCGAIPSGATNVFWQLITLVGGDKPMSQAHIEATLLGVTVS
ncbi:MAG: hypothetical protein ACM368_09420 [Gemmatimonadota bacterium]